MCFPFAVADFRLDFHIDSYIDLSGKSAENFQKQKCTKKQSKIKGKQQENKAKQTKITQKTNK